MKLNDPRLLSHINLALASGNIADIPLPYTLDDFHDVQHSVAAIGLGVEFVWFNNGGLLWVADSGCKSPVAGCRHGSGHHSNGSPSPVATSGVELMVALVDAYTNCLLVQTQSLILEHRQR